MPKCARLMVVFLCLIFGQPKKFNVMGLKSNPDAEVEELEINPNEPKFVRTQDELARVFGFRSRKTIFRYSRLKGAPRPRSDGRLCVADWRRFLSNQGFNEPSSSDALSLKEKQIVLQNKLLQQKFDEKSRLLVSQEEVEIDTDKVIKTAKAVLLAGPASLAPQVVGVSVQEAEILLKEWLHSALSKLEKNPLGRTTT